MKRRADKIALAVFVMTAAVFALYLVFSRMGANHSPILTCDSDTLSVSVSGGEEALLDGVSATDKEDGDLTDKILVESVSRFTDKGVCRITYAVQDSDGAVTRLERTLQYTDYTSPRFSLSAPLVLPYSKEIDPTVYLSATDCIDGDLTDSIQATLIGDSSYITGAGVWEVRFRVSNSMGDTVYLTTPIVITSSAQGAKNLTVNLKEYLVYLPLGSEFSPEDYLDSVTGEGLTQSSGELLAATAVTSNVDVNTAGDYTVSYTCQSVEGYTGAVNLAVVVYDPAA